jgi:hypothetical protein
MSPTWAGVDLGFGGKTNMVEYDSAKKKDGTSHAVDETKTKKIFFLMEAFGDIEKTKDE